MTLRFEYLITSFRCDINGDYHLVVILVKYKPAFDAKFAEHEGLIRARLIVEPDSFSSEILI